MDEEKQKFPGITGKLIGVGLGGLVPMLMEKLGKNNTAESEEEKKRRQLQEAGKPVMGMKKGGKVKSKSSSASKRADGIAKKGKTRGRFV